MDHEIGTAVCIWELPSGSPLHPFVSDEDGLRVLALSDRLVLLGDDARLRIWDAARGRTVLEAQRPRAPRALPDAASRAKVCAALRAGATVDAADLEALVDAPSAPAKHGRVTSADGRLVASGSDDGAILLSGIWPWAAPLAKWLTAARKLF
ncbi:hypothetical protein ACMHYB_00395 [Sorangium sp. So ce1128]